ncbi:glycoside hydrolase family 15 protein [Metallumcola ferriviriculae]|uniref:Glycoside hydrolase family 15 protein n=1 Tax=Metallumcola ferriviriculae TaxID=3039180 RepID=A0AAU0UT04_9FIRM|nr:glycoside hydrolase family 15 protein [Desulfitibacteraceae bacterium MK1]
MPREIVLGNGGMLVNFDKDLIMRDLYYPHVGWENHISGHKNAIGFWVDGKFSWIDDDGWNLTLGYLPETLVTDCHGVNERLGLKFSLNSAVHFRNNIFLQRMRLINPTDKEKEVRVFYTHDFSIDGSEVGDTALYDPTLQAVYHYKRNRYFLVNGQVGQQGLYQFAIGTKRFGGAEGTWRDAEDGVLEQNPIAQGSVDSTVSFRVILAPRQEEDLYYWIAVGHSYETVRSGNQYVLKNTPQLLLRKTGSYWHTWVNKHQRDFGDLSEAVQKIYKLSLLVTRTQVDDGGAIIAANDTDILHYARDHYSYMWPRDGALVALSLDEAGYPELTRNFFKLCERVLTKSGYLLHKYNPDGSVGSSWHPWVANGVTQLPIQEDETALVLFALWHHYLKEKDFEFVESLYKPLIRKAANFMVEYRDEATGLPLPSYDLWEERRGVFTFTASSVYGGLMAAASIANLYGDQYLVERYQKAADEVKAGIIKHLYSEDLGRFLRGVYVDQDNNYRPDDTPESSVYGVYAFGVLPADDTRVISTMEQIREHLWVKTDVGGIARYRNDYYFRNSDDIDKVPGNPWFICTLWLAEWYISKAGSMEDLEPAKTLISWAVDYSMKAGMLSEQLHPFKGDPQSVAPLTWSHSTYILTVNRYLEKFNEFTKRC